MKFKYVCVDCGKEFVTDKIIYQCPECAAKQKEGEFPRGYLKVIYDKEDLKKLAKKDHVTIYDFFPYTVPTPEVYPVGITPVVVPKRLNEKTGLKNVCCKMDAYLPSGSFKDRASQLIAAQAISHGEKRIALASTGNAGAAMSCAGAAYGLDIILFVPETAPINKLMQSVLYGATVVPVKGSYDDAFLLSIEYTKHFGGINRNTAYNPMTIEGKKSISIELFEQLGRKVPDVVYVPVGDGCIISGVYKGFYDLLQAGLIDKIPHIVCSQSEKSNAISMAFESISICFILRFSYAVRPVSYLRDPVSAISSSISLMPVLSPFSSLMMPSLLFIISGSLVSIAPAVVSADEDPAAAVSSCTMPVCPSPSGMIPASPLSLQASAAVLPE